MVSRLDFGFKTHEDCTQLDIESCSRLMANEAPFSPKGNPPGRKKKGKKCYKFRNGMGNIIQEDCTKKPAPDLHTK